MANEEMTHEEMWDDSGLVNSWDEAFEEYKKYHSLAARGEKVALPDPVLSEAEPQFETTKPRTTTTNGNQAGGAPPNFFDAQSTTGGAQPAAGAPMGAPVNLSGLAGLPQTLLGNTQDENLKNIMISWYYAGYYTGLYEGQRNAYASMQQQQGG